MCQVSSLNSRTILDEFIPTKSLLCFGREGAVLLIMFSAHVSGSGDSGSSLGQEHIVLCSWEEQFTLTEPLLTQVYTWVPANLMEEG